MEKLLEMLPQKLRIPVECRISKGGRYSEIRLRTGQPLMMCMGKRDEYVCENGDCTDYAGKGMIITNALLRSTLDCLCQYSLYAYQEQICNGFFTIRGGHRIGVAGEVYCDSSGKIAGMKYISFMNIRIAGEFRGISQEYLQYLYKEGEILNTLIVSPPGHGKTSFLRDLILQVSQGNMYGRGRNVGVVDERGELSGSARGIPVYDLGPRTDVIYGGTKLQAMTLLLRSMTPAVIAVDELGGKDEVNMLQEIGRSGVKVIATIHGDGLSELLRKEGVGRLLQGEFQRVIFLDTKQEVYGVKQIFTYVPEKGAYVECLD